MPRRTEQDDLQLYFSRLRPIYHPLFNLAHAITGSSEQAEYCLQYAVLDRWANGGASASRHGFREELRAATTRTALRLAGTEDAEFDWDGLSLQEGESDPLLHMIAQEDAELQRMLALRCGCGLSPRRIARLINAEPSRVHSQLQRFEARVRHRLSISDGRRTGIMLTRAVRGRMSQPCPHAPAVNTAFRTFQADAVSISKPHHLPARILRGALAVLLALVCVVFFWLAAVLIQPPALETPGEAVESIMD